MKHIIGEVWEYSQIDDILKGINPATGGDGVINYTWRPDLPIGLYFHGPAKTIFGVPVPVTSNPTVRTYTATGSRSLSAGPPFEINVVQPVLAETASLPATFTVVCNYPNPFRDDSS